jgi:hypothetical protein
MSLRKAIHTPYPQANVSAESKKGTHEAKQDVKSSGVSRSAFWARGNTTVVFAQSRLALQFSQPVRLYFLSLPTQCHVSDFG